MVSCCLEITTTRDIARQILRHRSFSFQEFSQRYADPTKDLGFVIREARLQDIKNRQNSVETDDKDLKDTWDEKQKDLIANARNLYKWAVDNGVAKEQARAVLPEGLIESKIYMNGTIRSWIHYIELRSGNGTQKEHREIAVACAQAIKPIFPMILEFVQQ
jgi:thymidylate synthase (FAD)